MSLRGASVAFIASGLPPREPEVPATERVALRLATFGTATPVELPPVESLDLVAQRILEALAAGRALGRRDLKRAPWCLWATATPLAQAPGVVERLLAAIAAAGRPRLFSALASAYVDGFAPERPGIVAIAAFLAERAEASGAPWAEAHRDLEIFSPVEGPKQVAATALARAVTPGEVLSGFGLGAPLGLTLAAMRAGFEHLAAGSNRDPLARLALVSRWVFDGEAVRFEDLRGVAVEAAVVPFGRMSPEGEARETALALAMRLLGDPRLETSRWTGTSRAEAIVRRWLDGAALVRFLEAGGAGGEDDPWAHRRAFWSALLAKGHVDAMRIVFSGAETGLGPTGAQETFGTGTAMAHFVGDTVPPGHSVLLMRVGTLVIADWSHGAPCFIWDEERGEVAPDLGQEAYEPDALRKVLVGSTDEANMAKQGRFLHRGSKFYKWQAAIADHLRGRRGIILTRSDYEVRP